MVNATRSILKNLIPKPTRTYLRGRKEYITSRYQFLLTRAMGALSGGQEDAIARLHAPLELSADLMIRGYAYGIFPAPSEHVGEWYDPPMRTTIPIEDYHIGSRLKSYIRKEMFKITFDQDFEGVLEGCSETKDGRETTWITPEVKAVFRELHQMGVVHTVEAWEDDELVGGVLGVSIGAFFATESLFYRRSQASKIAFAHLCAALKLGGYRLHDMQMPSGVSEQFGSVSLPREEYKRQLAEAIIHSATLQPPDLTDVV